jgi:multiple sugar transport system permease protein
MEVFSMATLTTPSIAVQPKKSSLARREAILFWVCVAPWVIGFILFTLGPMLYSLYISFTQWNIVTPPKWVGLQNYIRIFTQDPDFVQSLKVTSIYAIFSIPLSLITALFLAVLLNEATKGVSLFRTTFYLPTIVSSVAAAVLWQWIFNPRFGPVNGLLRLFGIEGPGWFSDPKYALWGLIIMSSWSVGGQMLIFLAGLKGIPRILYEAAEIDGAGRPARFWNITIPMLSPTIFFNLVLAVIGAFQTFDTAYVISTARAGTLGGPLKSTLFYMLNIYDLAFAKQRMGYATALAWILFLIIFVLTMITLRSSALWVYNEAERK